MFRKKLTCLLVRVCSLTQHNFQFYFHEVLKPINEPSKNFQNLKKTPQKLHLSVNIVSEMNFVYKWSLERNNYGFHIV